MVRGQPILGLKPEIPWKGIIRELCSSGSKHFRKLLRLSLAKKQVFGPYCHFLPFSSSSHFHILHLPPPSPECIALLSIILVVNPPQADHIPHCLAIGNICDRGADQHVTSLISLRCPLLNGQPEVKTSLLGLGGCQPWALVQAVCLG